MDGTAGTSDPNSSLGKIGKHDPNSSFDFGLNKYDMIKSRRRTAKPPILQMKEGDSEDSEDDELVIDSDTSVRSSDSSASGSDSSSRRSDSTAFRDKFDIIKSRSRSCKAPILGRKDEGKDDTDDGVLVIDSEEESRERKKTNTAKIKKKQDKPQSIEKSMQGPAEGGQVFLPRESRQAEDVDALYDEALSFVTETRSGTISGVQREFKISWSRASRILKCLEVRGVVSAQDKYGRRQVLASANKHSNSETRKEDGKDSCAQVNKKNGKRQVLASVNKHSNSETEEEDDKDNCAQVTNNEDGKVTCVQDTKKKGRGRPRKDFQVKNAVTRRKPELEKSCRTKRCAKSDHPVVVTLEDSDEEVKPKQEKSKKIKTSHDPNISSGVQNIKMDVIQHLKSSHYDLEGNKDLKKKDTKRKTLEASTTKKELSSDDEVLESANTGTESRVELKLQEQRERSFEAIAKKKPTPVVLVKDCLKSDLLSQIRGDFRLGSESESELEEDIHPFVINVDDEAGTNARIMAQLRGDLKLPSESDSEDEISDDTEENVVSKTKNKVKGSGDVIESEKRCKSKPRINIAAIKSVVTMAPTKKPAVKKEQTLGHVIKVKIGGGKTTENDKCKELNGKSVNSTKKDFEKTEVASLENSIPSPESPDITAMNVDDPGLKSTSGAFVKAKYLVMQKRGFNTKQSVEKGSFEENFRKNLMRADILKVAQSLDDGCLNNFKITENLFDDSMEPEDVVVSVKPEDLLNEEATVKQVKVEKDSTFSSDSEVEDVEETLEEKMTSLLKSLKSFNSPEETVPTPKKNSDDDKLLERKILKLVDLINSAGSVRCVERSWDKVVSKTVQKSMPRVQLEETTKKFAEIHRQLNRERWLRKAGANVKEDIPVAVKKEPPKPEVAFKPLKPTMFKIPKKTRPKKAYTKTAEMWKQALKVDENACFKIDEAGRRVLLKACPRDRRDYTEIVFKDGTPGIVFKDETAKNPEIKGEVQIRSLGAIKKTSYKSPEKPLFASSPKRITSEEGPLLTSSPRRLSSLPATTDLLFDMSGSSDNLAGNISYFGESISFDYKGFDQTDDSFDGANQNEEVAADVLKNSRKTHSQNPSPHSMESHSPSIHSKEMHSQNPSTYSKAVRALNPSPNADLPQETGLGEGTSAEKDWKGNSVDSLVVKENGKSNCDNVQSTKSIFSSLLKKTLNMPKT